jgi:hypothetical protein
MMMRSTKTTTDMRVQSHESNLSTGGVPSSLNAVYEGRLLLSLNFCDAGFTDVNASNMWQRAPRAEGVPWPADAGFECTVIAISDGKIVNANATHFVRMMQSVAEAVRLRQVQGQKDIQDRVDAAWRETRESPENWLPPPTVKHHSAHAPSPEEAARQDSVLRETMAAFEPTVYVAHTVRSREVARDRVRLWLAGALERTAGALEKLAAWLRGLT